MLHAEVREPPRLLHYNPEDYILELSPPQLLI